MAETLPQEMRLDTRIEKQASLLDNLLEDRFYFERMDLDSQMTSSIESTGKILQVSYLFAKSLGGEELEAHQSAYRAFVFSYEMAEFVSTVNFSVSLGDYTNQLAESQNAGDKLRDDAEDYLRSRPAIENFITTYISDLDPTKNDWTHIAHTVSGVVFMLIEKGMGEQYSDQVIKKYAAEFDSL